MSELLLVEGVYKRYGDDPVVCGVSLALSRGEVKVLVGPSGSGKSTLLRCIALLEPIDDGQIVLEGKDVSWPAVPGGWRKRLSERRLARNRQKLGMVFQSFNLFPHLNALDNVSLGPRVVQKRSAHNAREDAIAWLERVGLQERMHAFPSELSGGQQQRVAIARALIMQPRVLLLDEPTAALDAELTREVLETLRKLAESGVTMLAVTHELSFAKHAANEIIMLDAGRIIESAPPATFFSQPRHERTRRFLEFVEH